MDNAPPKSKFQSLMSALKDINFELDGASRTVAALDSQVARFRPPGGAFGSQDAQRLLDDIDKELKKSPKKQPEQQEQDDQGQEDEEVPDSKRPRNYHPPESPVRRVFEDGVEVGPPFPGVQLAYQGQAQQFATPGYPQSLYPA